MSQESKLVQLWPIHGFAVLLVEVLLFIRVGGWKICISKLCCHSPHCSSGNESDIYERLKVTTIITPFLSLPCMAVYRGVHSGGGGG